MPIETLDDWNDRLTSFGQIGCGCCEMPGIDGLSIDSERIAAIVAVNGLNDTITGDYWLKDRTDYSSGGYLEFTWTPDFFGSVGGVIFSDGYTVTSGPPSTGTSTRVLSILNNPTTALASGKSAIDAALDWVTMTKTTGSNSSFEITSTSHPGGFALAHIFYFPRFRFKIPSVHTGTFCKITYDILESPVSSSPFLFTEDIVVDWIGPGDQSDPDDESWLTDWQYIDPPDDEGSRSIVNIRFSIIEISRYGNKPQIIGDTFP